MSRKPRAISSTGIYHVVLRSVNQHIIFEEESDYHKFLFILSDCKTRFDIEIYAYCLMDNHVHLLLYSSPDQLASFFQSLGSRFVRWYNGKYSRTGHMFQERYHSVPIESRAQYINTLLYIHNNPVKASICRIPSEYRWSSFRAFYGEHNPLLDLSRSYEIAGSKKILLDQFASGSIVAEESTDPDNSHQKHHFLPDDKAHIIFQSVTQLSSVSEVTSLPKIKRNEYIKALYHEGLTMKQVARLMDVSLSTVKRFCK